MNFDQVLVAIGGFGKYQKILYVWICLPNVLLAFHMMVSIFTGATPPHLCLDSLDPVVQNQTSDYTTLFLNFSQTNSCARSESAQQDNWTDHPLCVHGWVYSNETFYSTTVSEWDLVCEKAHLNSLSSSIYMFGLLVGSVVFGALADRYGRRLILLLSIALQTVFGVAAAFAPNLIVYVMLRVLPQSARWLLANDRKEEAIALLRKAALVNGRVLPPSVQVEKCAIVGGYKGSYTALDLVRTPQMRKQTLILFYIWFVNVLVYYGLSLGVSRLGTNLYLTQFVFGLVEIPARSLVLFVLPFSRRFSQSGFLAVGGLACLLMLAVPADHPNVLTGLAMVGKFGITASFAVIYVYTAEIFPTVLRQTGIGMSSMFARMGGVLAPIINMLHNHSPTTPLVIFGMSPLLGTLLALMLRETADKPLPDTVEDVENWDKQSSPSNEKPKVPEHTSNSGEQEELQQLASHI